MPRFELFKKNHNENTSRKIFRQLHGREKLQYIWDYYKFPIFAVCILLYIAGYMIYGHFTHKDVLLSTAFVNVSPGNTLAEKLGSGFLDYIGGNDAKEEVRFYTGLYLTDNDADPNHEYTYASKMKILGTIDNEELDIVLMNKEAFDSFSQNGYLCDLEELLSKTDSDLYSKLSSCLEKNIVILEDNAMDLYFDSTATYTSTTAEYPMGLNISGFPCIKEAGMNGTIYLGIIANSPHKKQSVEYIRYLSGNTTQEESYAKN